jgi:hypothetical protein
MHGGMRLECCWHTAALDTPTTSQFKSPECQPLGAPTCMSWLGPLPAMAWLSFSQRRASRLVRPTRRCAAWLCKPLTCGRSTHDVTA